MNAQTVLVDGATGYLGNHVVSSLIRSGATVHALIRPQARAEDRAFLEQAGCKVFEGELALYQDNLPATQRRKLDDAFAGVTHAVHLIGSIAPTKDEKFDQLHRDQSRAFASWCVRAKNLNGFKRALMVTALGADSEARSEYLRSKRAGEMALLAELEAANIGVTIFRPSLIIGRLVGSRDSKLMKRYRTLAATRPLVPLINGGHNLVQPVFVGDLADAIAGKVSAAENNNVEIVEIGGAEQISMRALVGELLAVLGIKKNFLDLPPQGALFVAGLMERFQKVPLLSKDQAIMACHDNVCTDNALGELISPEPVTTVRQALETYETNRH